MTNAWTKGPWNVFTAKQGHQVIGIGEVNGDGIADCGFGVWRGGDAEALANARLIAAAPDMAEALESIISEIKKYHPTFDANIFVNAERILAKARGAP